MMMNNCLRSIKWTVVFTSCTSSVKSPLDRRRELLNSHEWKRKHSLSLLSVDGGLWTRPFIILLWRLCMYETGCISTASVSFNSCNHPLKWLTSVIRCLRVSQGYHSSREKTLLTVRILPYYMYLCILFINIRVETSYSDHLNQNNNSNHQSLEDKWNKSKSFNSRDSRVGLMRKMQKVRQRHYQGR